MKIYYSVGVTLHNPHVKSQIHILSTFGDVLTKDLDKDDGGDIKKIYIENKKLLLESDFFVADISDECVEVGFMIATAIKYNKPVLCVYYQPTGEKRKVSPIITGCLDIMTLPYCNMNEFKYHVKRFLLENYPALKHLPPINPTVFISGIDVGKHALCAQLADTFNFVHISTGDILRQLLIVPEELFSEDMKKNIQTIKHYMSDNLSIPVEIMRAIVKNRINQIDCKLFGYILHDYPSSYEDLLDLRNYCANPDLVLRSECPDFDPEYLEFKDKWFPRTPVIRIKCNIEAFDVIKYWKTYHQTRPTAFTYRPHFAYPPFIPKDVKLRSYIDEKNKITLFGIASYIHTDYPASETETKTDDFISIRFEQTSIESKGELSEGLGEASEEVSFDRPKDVWDELSRH
jgi:adenylate kinase family enzyme